MARTKQTARKSSWQPIRPTIKQTTPKTIKEQPSRAKMPRKVKGFRKPTTFRLLDLPQELVDNVYKQSLRAGSTNILQASHQVYARASQIIDREGVYRITAHECSAGMEYTAGDEALDFKTLYRIRNVQIRVLPQNEGIYDGPAPSYSLPWNGALGPYLSLAFGPQPQPLPDNDNDIDPHRLITGSKVPRGSCHVIIQTDLSDATTSSAQDFFDLAKNLTGFENLSFVYEKKPRATATRGRKRSLTKKEQESMFKTIRKELEPVLGTGASIVGDKDVLGGLEFCPLSHQAAVAASHIVLG